jgi:dTDP-4-amino-4,6-dideoxygalactose transaminase
MPSDAIYVTRAGMPQFGSFCGQLKEIFDSGWLTNDGPYVRQLETALSAYLGCPYLVVCNNGTTALMLALHCAGLRGKKVAVTAYTYVATLSALLWIGCTPVFVDIDPKSLCMSAEKLDQAFTEHPDIAGVLPVQIYGLACDDTALSDLCRIHHATLIYDAAQAFGSTWQGRSLLDFGDYSICSFHATKIFHTVEGGCIVAHTKEAQEALALARAFGHRGDTHYTLGINAKMSEIHAAMGLCLLQQTQAEIARCKELHAIYDLALTDLSILRPRPAEGLDWNFSYYPVLLPDEKILQHVIAALAEENVYPRRYFYPALTELPYIEQWMKTCFVAENVARRVLCLPLYAGLEAEIAERIAHCINQCLAD